MTDIVQRVIDRGLSIHPCRANGKEALLKNWPNRASNDPAVIAAWNFEFPNCNFGAVANHTFCILESDNLAALQAKLNGPLPVTYRVEARENRPHLYFKQTAASRAAGNLDLPGIFEFKQNNRYVIAESSTHPTGASYLCTCDAPIAEIPAWLVADLIRLRAGSGSTVSGPLPAEGEKFGEGEGRHTMLMSEAGRLWDGEKSEEQLFEELEAINAKYCDPVQPAHKTLSQVQWIMTKEPNVRGPKVMVGQPQPEIEEARIELPPDSVPRLMIRRADYIDQLAHELTSGTHLPFSYARESIKLMLLAGLPSSRPVLEWFPVHTRQYLVQVSVTPGTGKSESFRRVRATFDKATGEERPFGVQVIRGDLLGSPQFACSELGGTITKPGGKASGIVVDIRPVTGRVVFYDEGKRLLQNDSLGSGERGLVTMFTQLFDDNGAATGSFKNGRGEVHNADASLVLNFTRSGFNEGLAGSGTTRDGFLSRCTLVSDSKDLVDGQWKKVVSSVVRDLVQKLYECRARTELPEDADAIVERNEVIRWIRRQDQMTAARLEFLFVQDLYARSMFSVEGRITKEAVELAGRWIRHQLVSRQVLWPQDTSRDKYERMEINLRAQFKIHPRMSDAQVAHAVNARREGSGGMRVFQRALQSLTAAGEIKIVGRTRKGRAMYECVPE